MKLTLAALLLSTTSAFAASEKFCPELRQVRREMSVVADNIVNVETTRTPEGGPYRMKRRVCVDGVCTIKRIKTFKAVYQPEHPDADENGYVSYPGYSLKSQSDKMDHLVVDYEVAARACDSQN